MRGSPVRAAQHAHAAAPLQQHAPALVFGGGHVDGELEGVARS